MSAQEDSDSDSDVDYVPTDGEDVSVEEDSGEDESNLHLDNITPPHLTSKKRKRAIKPKFSNTSRKRQGGIRLENETECSHEEKINSSESKIQEQIHEEQLLKQQENEDKRTEDLWQSFLTGVKQPLRHTPKNTASSTQSTKKCDTNPPETKASDVKTYDFAGEKITICETVDKSVVSEQSLGIIKENTSVSLKTSATTSTSTTTTTPEPRNSVLKRPSTGLQGILGKINKTPKLSCLDKSKLDWDSFKEKEGISDELRTHNKGKDGYIERLDFLSRTDQRQFTIERDLRQSSRKYLPP